MKALTNKELAQRAMEQYNRLTRLKESQPNKGKDSWWDQEELNKAFAEGLRKQSENAAYLYWLAGNGNEISSKQEKELQWQLEYNNDTVILPLNHDGVHWTGAVFERDANGVWQAYHVDNVGVAGLCGKRTVDQSLEILKVGVKVFAQNNPGLVRKVDSQDSIYQPVQRILDNVNGTKSESHTAARTEVKSYSPDMRNYDFDAAVRENERFLQNENPFSYELGKLAHTEIALQKNGNDQLAFRDLQKSQALLTKMLTNMSPQERQFAINRLGPHIREKASISKMITPFVAEKSSAVVPVKLSEHANRLVVSSAKKAVAATSTPEPAAHPSL